MKKMLNPLETRFLKFRQFRFHEKKWNDGLEMLFLEHSRPQIFLPLYSPPFHPLPHNSLSLTDIHTHTHTQIHPRLDGGINEKCTFFSSDMKCIGYFYYKYDNKVRHKSPITQKVTVYLICVCCAFLLSCVRLFVTPWTVVCHASLSVGTLQARILECVATSYSGGSSQARDWTHVFWVPCTGKQVLYHRTTWEVTYFTCILNIRKLYALFHFWTFLCKTMTCLLLLFSFSCLKWMILESISL